MQNAELGEERGEIPPLKPKPSPMEWVGFGEDEQRNGVYTRACEGETKCSLRGRADVMELADMQDLGSCAERYAGSSPAIRTSASVLIGFEYSVRTLAFFYAE